jgi:alkylation response protein AidB-like acyl-CoA dehydrogenase
MSEDDRQQVRLSVEKFAADQYTFEKRKLFLRDPARAPKGLLATMGESGWLAIGVTGDKGGLDGSDGDLGIILEQVGRSLMVEPVLSSAALCAPLLAACSSTAADAALPRVLEGQDAVALAHAEPDAGFADAALETRADGGTVTGRKAAVLDGGAADRLLVTARTPTGTTGLYLVEAGAKGVSRHAYMSVDERRMADIAFDAAPAVCVAEDAAALVRDAINRALVAAGYEASGAMAALIDMTAQYLQQRHQFGKPLSSFQVLQHRLVDMFVASEEARAMLDIAARTRDVADITAAKVLYARAAKFVAQNAVQMHGGMGMTDELAVSHYFRRLTFLSTLFGDADHHIDRYVEVAG